MILEKIYSILCLKKQVRRLKFERKVIHMVTRIVPLKGAERVRRRPAVIFGDIGDAGAMHAVEKMIHILGNL